MEDKTRQMLASKEKEMIALGTQVVREKYPAIWAAMLNYTGALAANGQVPAHAMEQLEKNQQYNVGSKVRYRGMEGAPTMVVTSAAIQNVPGTRVYATFVSAKYFNKGNSTFISVTDRVECFDIIDDKKETNE